ncbi:dihydrolipoyllysine-residue acetyltransferase [Aquicella lusitana]|uniref:dihydrolipoyllysine-residue acetyltransferase n=1 Tax=Aquicella lusitana TaxID=254246 RepID=UPI001E4FFA33|nr:dihydrolipoyllysine-residue acetyltransferase [Aquicella lusitana]
MAQLKNITVPDLGGATDVTVIEVLVKPGDKIEKDTSIVTLESDKATLDVPSTDAGVVKEVKIKVGDKVSSDAVILTLETSGAAAKAEEKKPTDAKPEVEKEKAKAPESKEEKKPAVSAAEDVAEEASTSEESKVLTGTVQSTSDVHAGPGVRQLARELGVNLTLISGSGPKQRILKEDVQAYVKAQLSQVQGGTSLSLPAMPAIDFSKFGPVESQALSRIKKISGKNLQRNWMMIPHVTQFGEADITTLEKFRQTKKNELEKQNIKLTPLVFIMKAVVASLKAFPHFNASLDAASENLVMKKYFNLGVAVDTPDGLVVPVIRDVDKKGLSDLAKELADVSEKARKKQLTPGDMQGGCFSISSLGGIGGTAFTPIINYPEVAILGVSKSSYKPVYQDGEFVPRLMLPLSLSYDHRVIDGADGARFMVHLTNMLSDIRNLLL